MFEFMYKYRVPILAVLLLGLVGFGAWTAIAGLFQRQKENPVWGKFSLPGTDEEIEVHRIRVQRFAERFSRDPNWWNQTFGLGLGDQEPEQMAWGTIILAEAARRAGVEISEKVLDGMLRSMTGVAEDEKLRVPDEQREFWEDVLLAAQFRSRFRQRAGDADYSEVYERYKTDNEELNARYVIFERPDPESFTLDLTTDEDKRTLVDYWEANPNLKTLFGLPEQVDFEVIWVKFQDKGVAGFGEEFAANWAELTKDLEVSDAEIQARFENHREVYEELAREEAERRATELAAKQREENERAEAEGREPRNLSEGDQPGEFELVKDYVRQEILMGKLLHKAWEQAKNDGTELEALATRYGLKFAKKEKMDRQSVMTQPDYGTARVWQMLQGDFQAGRLKEGEVATYTTTSTGRYMDDIFDEPTNFMAVFKLVDFREPRAPELKEVREKVIEHWQKQQADDAVKAKAEAFKKAIDDKVLAKLSDRVAELEKKRDEAVAKEVADKELDPDNDDHKPRIEAIRLRFQREMDRELNKDKAAHEAQAFADAAREMGLEVESTGWVRKNSGSVPQFPEGLSLAEKKRRLLRQQQRLQRIGGMEPGRVGDVDLDPKAGLAVVAVLDEKRQPEPVAMYSNPAQVRSIQGQLNRNVARDDFRFQNYKSKEWFDLVAPETEKAIQEQKDSELRRQQRAARRRQLEAERRRRAAEEAARKAGAGKPDVQPAEGTTDPDKDG